MSEFDELVASPGVLMAGRFGADGRVAEHKTTGLHIENPVPLPSAAVRSGTSAAEL
jgi:roadblock/LC7 domain-containing protein